jgi:hypothetical protein
MPARASRIAERRLRRKCEADSRFGMTVSADKTVSLSLDGGVSKMFNLTGTISNQFMQLFDLYAIEAATNLTD